jgi:SPP1 family phage portal protein
LARLVKLYKYYVAQHSINDRTMADPTKPNNKIVNPYANLITSSLVGYFVGEPITYNAEDTDMLKEL